jgi:hypothetical protein
MAVFVMPVGLGLALAEVRRAEVGGRPPAVGEGAGGVLGVERPQVEVFDAGPAVDVVERRALAEGDTDNAVGVDAPARATGEAGGAIGGGDVCEALKVAVGDRRVRALADELVRNRDGGPRLRRCRSAA